MARAADIKGGIDLRIRGHLSLARQLQFLQLSGPERRRLHAWLAADVERAMRKAVRERVEASPLSLFDSSDRVRRRKARSFARMIGRAATAEKAVLFDKGIGHNRPARSGDGATEEQAERMRELGFRLSKTAIRRRFSKALAGFIIRDTEQRRGIVRKRRRASLNGSLILMVWREEGETILAQVNPEAVFRRFIRAKLDRAA